jgi:alcohol dehydrogenase class IV
MVDSPILPTNGPQMRLSPARTFVVPKTDTVTFGVGALAEIAGIVDKQLSSRALLLISHSLRGTAVEANLRSHLGDRLRAVRDDIPQHVPMETVINIAASARSAEIDCVISVGGGTPIDAAKAVAMCVSENITTKPQLQALRIKAVASNGITPIRNTLIPHIAVPTTLSGAEHTGLVGVTDESTHEKAIFSNPALAPDAVILDPEVAALTPEWLWSASGIRAVDHAVEGILSSRNMPMMDGLALEALRLLTGNLKRSVDDAFDAQARMNCMHATWLSIFALTNVGIGLSHGIGHQLAAEFNLLHGITSAIMLPLVMEYNASATTIRLRRIAEAMGVDTRGLSDERAGLSAIAAVRKLIHSVKVPHTLRAVGAVRTALPSIAARTMEDPSIAANITPVTEGDVRHLLEKAW